MNETPSLWKIVKTDQIALIGAAFPPISLALAALAATGWLPQLEDRVFELSFVDPEDAPIFLFMALVSLVLGVGVLAWRHRTITLAMRGVRVPGVVVKITPFKDRAYLHYRYSFEAVEITTMCFVHQTAAVKRVVLGQEVTVSVDPTNPKRAFVIELFAD